MPAHKRKSDFFETEEGIAVEQILKAMSRDEAFHTAPSYSSNSTLYPNNLIPFVDKHMNYIRSHPATDPRHYLANLRLMTRLK